MKPQVICLPGSVAPAADRYRPLVDSVGDAADLHLKDLEVYREEQPPADYAIELELQGIDRLADALGLVHFHLVGYSGGGFCSLAYAGTRPERLLSLAVFEPARIPGPLSAAEREFMRYLEGALSGKQGGEFMSAFVQAQVKPGVQLPPAPASVSPEMRKRPAGIAAMIRAFEAYGFNRDLLRGCTFPVYYAYGDLSHEEQAQKAGILSQLFSDIHVQRFAGVHHFVPPEQIYVPAQVRSMQDLWRRAAARVTAAPIILVPGFWLGAWAWDEVADLLRGQGHDVTALTLPGLEPAHVDRSTITLADQVDAIVKAVEASVSPVVLAVHSGASVPGYAASDRVPGRIAAMVYVDTAPTTEAIDPKFAGVEKPMPLLEELKVSENLDGLSDDQLATFARRAVPEPGAAIRDAPVLTNPARLEVPSTVIATGYTSGQYREAAKEGQPWLAGLNELRDLTYVDLPTSHWPMWSRPQELAAIIGEIATQRGR